uniref:NADH-ubiquinone oxidoreductase chain 2 n=1 Tax=Paxillus rubicundulus TaxID=463315 RepID=A0A5Q0N4S0_9AGAM|nr:NADH dehydrogenase subunit 2 [Paxillus rubicundulus]QFZ98787.1 NADH dehydrogenase subunit 2 [Paxillus rubicundulus]
MIFISLLILIMAIAIPSIRFNLSPNLFIRLTAIIFIFAAGLACNSLYIQSIESGLGIYSGLFHVTVTSQFIDIFIFITAALILTAWPIFNKQLFNNSYKNNSNFSPELDKFTLVNNNSNPTTEYSLIILFSTLGSSLLLSSADFISMYLSLELQSFGVYILATLYRNSESATAAGLKYFLLGGLSSCVILLGIALIYSYSGITNFESIFSLNSVLHAFGSYQSSSLGIILGFIFIFLGLLFKIAAAPLHNWAPDVYDNSPTIVTIWLTIIPKISIIFLLFEIINGLNLSTTLVVFDSIQFLPVFFLYLAKYKIVEIRNLLLLSALISLIIGTIVGLSQIRIKRLLAYSTISHIGFILLALAINSVNSIEALYFYIFQYTLTNLNVFLILLAFGYIINSKNLINNNLIEADINFISQLKGQFFNNPILSLSLSICLFSMAGVPPLIGFFSKYYVLYSAISSQYYLMAIIAILTSVISASYYIKIIRILHTEDNNSKINEIENNELVLNNFHSFLISSLTLAILLFLIKPTIILNSVQLLSILLFDKYPISWII